MERKVLNSINKILYAILFMVSVFSCGFIINKIFNDNNSANVMDVIEIDKKEKKEISYHRIYIISDPISDLEYYYRSIDELSIEDGAVFWLSNYQQTVNGNRATGGVTFQTSYNSYSTKSITIASGSNSHVWMEFSSYSSTISVETSSGAIPLSSYDSQSDNYRIASDIYIILSAIKHEEPCEITFMNGTSELSSQIVQYNTTTKLTGPTPTKSGYTFVGWSKEENTYKVNYRNNYSYKFTDDVVLYPVWNENGTKMVEATFYSNEATFGGTQSETVVTRFIDANSYAPTGIFSWKGYNLNDFCLERTTSNGAPTFSWLSSYATAGSSYDLYAQWNLSNYMITYKLQGGTVSGTNPTRYNIETSTITLINPTRTGYTFLGWTGGGYTEPTLKAQILKGSTGGKTFTANWLGQEYTLTFNGNGGTPSSSTKKVNFESAYGTLPGASKEGYTFDGWYTSASGGDKVEETTIYNVEGNQTLYAHWTVNNYTITFNSNGGSAVAAKTQGYGSTVTAPTAPTRTGYTFGGWYRDNNTFANAYTFSTMPAQNTTLYAKWIANKYTITFEENGGSAVTDITQDFDTTVTKPANPTKTGYTFAGWYTDNNTFTNAYTFLKMPASNITLYAKWTANAYTVTFDANTGACETANKSVTYDEAYGTLPEATKEGYTFDGWYTSASGGDKVEETTIYNVEGNQTLYAHWTVNEYTITFNSNGGTEVEAITAAFGSTVTSPSEPTRVGHTFGGWYTDNNTFEDAYTFTTMPASNITLYAKWEINEYTITFEENGGSAVTDITQDFGTTVTKPIDPTREGYTFDGWYTDDNTFENEYTFTTMGDEDVTLYAKWTANTYTVTFDANTGACETANKSVTYDEAYGTLPEATKEGYTFDGWYTDELGGDKVEETTIYNVEGNQTLYAHWIANKYTISFDSNGGTPNTIQQMEVVYNDKVGTLPIVSKTRYDFVGWFTEKDGEGTQITDVTIYEYTNDIILYAYYEKSISVIEIKETSNYEYIKHHLVIDSYEEDGEKYEDEYYFRKGYNELNLVHGVDDTSWSRVVLGNVPYGTTLAELLNNIETPSSLLRITTYDGEVIYENDIVPQSFLDDWEVTQTEFMNSVECYSVGTGTKIELISDGVVYDIIYISVLGDTDGDGIYTATDYNLLREYIKAKKIDSLDEEFKLACYILNQGAYNGVLTAAEYNEQREDVKNNKSKFENELFVPKKSSNDNSSNTAKQKARKANNNLIYKIDVIVDSLKK